LGLSAYLPRIRPPILTSKIVQKAKLKIVWKLNLRLSQNSVKAGIFFSLPLAAGF